MTSSLRFEIMRPIRPGSRAVFVGLLSACD